MTDYKFFKILTQKIATLLTKIIDLMGMDHGSFKHLFFQKLIFNSVAKPVSQQFSVRLRRASPFQLYTNSWFSFKHSAIVLPHI
jgi:hypothetical protein